MNIIDVLTTFKSLKVPFGLFIELATPIKPRFYSISSSPAVYPAAVHVTIGVQQWEASIGVERQSRQGLCSGYVAGVKANSRIYCAIKPCPTFRLPKVIMSTDTTPIICVGAGTGVAPFRGFLQERAASGSTAKDTLLFFGCTRAVGQRQKDN
jgi:cytochrome P450/NADPH-cytochrome P450 reductase